MDVLNVVGNPLKFQRGNSLVEDGSSRCPYCLEKLQTLQDDLSSAAKPPCPICQHMIPRTILGVGPHAFNRAQQWDFLDNELDYLLKGKRRDVESYIFAMGEYYNPDFMEAKDHLMEMVMDRAALVRLREEFLESEEDLETLILQYLRKRRGDESGLAKLLLSGEKWRQWARGLSAEGAGPRLIVEFQLDYVKHLFWGVFESMRTYEDTIRYLKDRLDQLGAG